MTRIIIARDPLDFACPNKNCNAGRGVACRTVGRHINASPHTSRLRLAVRGTLERDNVEGDDDRAVWSAALERYTRGVLRELLNREATTEELARARREGSLKPDRGWLRDAIGRFVVQRAQPTKRRQFNGAVTLWGRITHEESLPGGGFLLQLHTGEYVHMPAEMWAELWPERKAGRLELEREHEELRGGWWRFMIDPRGKCTAADEEPDRDETPSADDAPGDVPGQMALF